MIVTHVYIATRYTNSTIAKLALLASKLGATVSGDEPKTVETSQAPNHYGGFR